ncbi:MAG: phosphatase PAP2 family protein [Lachnospiraceae bacterium]|nr:phosphatase PAP2 family protein [Lachnospiraceae bacterium]
MSLLYALSEIRIPLLNTLLSVVSFLGSEVFLLLAMALCFWCYDKRLAYRLSFSFIIAGTLGHLLKVIFHMPSPVIRDSSFKPVDGILRSKTTLSFPSMRSLGIGCISITALMKEPRIWAKIIAVIFLILVPFSQLYLGLDTLLDIGFGLIIAIVVTILVNKYMDNTATDRTQYLKFMFILLIFPVVLLCVSLALFYNEVIAYDNMLEAVKSSGIFSALIISWYFESTYINFSERCDRWWMQLIKIVLGLAIVFGLNAGFKSLFGLFGENFWAGDFLRYFLITGFIFGAYPIFIKQFLSARHI